jgi:hypothetical protein
MAKGWRDGETVSGDDRMERAEVLRKLCAPLIKATGTRRRDSGRDIYTLKPIGTALELMLTVAPMRRETELTVCAGGKQMFAMKWSDSRMRVSQFTPGGWELGAIEVGRQFAERSRAQ